MSLILGGELRHEKVKWLLQVHMAGHDRCEQNLCLILLWCYHGVQELWTGLDTSMQT